MIKKFIKGWASACDPTLKFKLLPPFKPMSDEEAFASDREAIGGDMYKALEKAKSEYNIEDNVMDDKCEKGCIVAQWGTVSVLEPDKERLRRDFDKAIKEFDTTHEAIPHPGFWTDVRFCPNCGKRIT